MLHRFDSFKSCFGVIEKWEKNFFGDFRGVRLFYHRKPKKKPQKNICAFKQL